MSGTSTEEPRKPRSEVDRGDVVRALLADGVILGAVTAFGYAIANLYEHGFADGLGIPPRLVSVTLSGGGAVALEMLFVLGAGGYVLLLIAGLGFFHSVLGVLTRRVLKALLIFGLVLFVGGLRAWKIALGFSLLVPLEILGTFLLSRRFKTVFKEDLLDAEEDEGHGFIARIVGRPRAFWVTALIVAVYLARLTGLRDADSQVDYPVLSDDPSAVVLQIYGDRLILGRIQTDGGLAPEYTVRSLEKDPVRLTVVRVGPFATPQPRVLVLAPPEPPIAVVRAPEGGLAPSQPPTATVVANDGGLAPPEPPIASVVVPDGG